MFQIKQNEATAVRRRIPILLVDITDGFTPETGITAPTVNISKNGATVASGAGTFTEIGNGQYYYEFTAGEVDTLGWIAVNVEKATVTRDYNAVVQVMAYDAMDVVRLGLTAIPNVAQGTSGALPTGNATGQVTVATNNDKTGYALTQTFPANFSSLAITVGGAVTAGTVSDKSGYSLATSQTFSTTGSVGSVTGSVGSVTGAVGSVTGNVGGNVTGSVGSLTGTAVQNIWDDVTSSLTTVGSIGKLLVDNVNATISSRSTLTDTQVWAAATRTLTSGANIVLAKGTGVTGFNDITAQNVWDTATSGLTTAGSIGLKLNTNVDATISSRMATFTYTTPPTAAAIATQVWSEALPGTYTSGQAGFKLNAAGSAADPWATALPGAYSAGSAGFIIGNRLDTNVGSRMATFTYTTPPTTAAIATQVWSEALPGSYTSGQAGFKLNAAGTASDPWSTALPGAYSAGSAGNIIGNMVANTWSAGTRTLTAGTNIVLAKGTGITGFNDITAQSVWDVLASTVSLTNSIGLQLKTNVDATVSSRSTLTAANVWATDVSGYVTAGQAGTFQKNTDVLTSTRMATFTYTAPLTAGATASAVWDALLASYTVNNSFGQRVLRSTTSQSACAVTGANHIAADVHELQPAVITAADFSAGAIDANALATSAVTEIQTGLATSTALATVSSVTDKLNTAMQLDGAVYQFTTNALELAPTGGGPGGGSVAVLNNGPYTLVSDTNTMNESAEVFQNDVRTLVFYCVDPTGAQINMTGATLTAKVYNAAGTLVATYSATSPWLAGGVVEVGVTTSVTGTAGTYTLTITRTTSASDTTIFGPLRLYVRNV